jgi:hypothetical protein
MLGLFIELDDVTILPDVRIRVDHIFGRDTRPELDQGFMVVMGLDHIDQFFDVIRQGQASTLAAQLLCQMLWCY